MARKRITDQELEYIKHEYLNGKSINDIADDLHSCFRTVSEKLKEMGIFQYKKRRWTDEEIRYLQENYANTDWIILLKVLYKWNKDDIITKASRLNLKREVFFWNDEDIKILKDAYNDKLSVKEISVLLGHKFSEDAILTKAYNLGIKQREFWSVEEENLLIDNYRIKDMDEICQLLPRRSHDCIINKASKLGLVHKTIWSDEELQYLIDNYQIQTDEEIALHIGRTKDSVRGKRFTEKLYHPISPGVYNYLSEYIRKRNKD